jgi:thioredoxin reductase (NADPH)
MLGASDLHSAAFPTLDERQRSELVRCTGASPARYHAGQTLFAAGDRDFKFFVIETGEIAILDPGTEPPRTVVVHGAGQFTGDVSHLTGSPAPVTAVARVDSQVYEVTPDRLRGLVDRCPELSDLILQAFIARRQLVRESGHFSGVRVIGSRYSPDTFRVRDFLAKNRVLFSWLDLEGDAEVNDLLRRFGLCQADTPVVTWRGQILRNPGSRQLAEALGLRRPAVNVVYDLVVVGAGPAGLAAAVYGASEGLTTLALERTAPGGQASGTMRIENYLGFPTGVSGGELAERAVLQANKFGAALSVAAPVTGLAFDNGYSVLQLEGGETAVTKCLVIATGAQYRRLLAEGCLPFEGRGVFYAATVTEAEFCQGADVVVVGGGNSAGQAAVFLARRARRVFLVVRGSSLKKSMSEYLARRVEQTENLEVLYDTTVVHMSGETQLEAVELVNQKSGDHRIIKAAALFSFIGATPGTAWLPPDIERDDKQFVRTGAAVAQSPRWKEGRAPLLLETSRPGVFAAGDVRSGSVKRFASAVGEGAIAVQLVHEYLKER